MSLLNQDRCLNARTWTQNNVNFIVFDTFPKRHVFVIYKGQDFFPHPFNKNKNPSRLNNNQLTVNLMETRCFVTTVRKHWNSRAFSNEEKVYEKNLKLVFSSSFKRFDFPVAQLRSHPRQDDITSGIIIRRWRFQERKKNTFKTALQKCFSSPVNFSWMALKKQTNFRSTKYRSIKNVNNPVKWNLGGRHRAISNWDACLPWKKACWQPCVQHLNS